MTNPAARRALTELYASQGWPAEGDELLQRSLGPRAPDLLLEAPGWLGLAAGQLVLDAGCRDATHPTPWPGATAAGCLASIWSRPGCPTAAEAASAGLGAQVALVAGDLEACRSPMAPVTWCGVVMSCRVGDGAAGASRMRPGAAIWGRDGAVRGIHCRPARPGDRSLLVEGLQNSPASMHQPTVEAAMAAAGFEMVRRERIGSNGPSTSSSTILAT
jgi:hypothetical protein